MALNGYFGKPGSGKSYSVVEYVVIPALKKGRHVVTNIPLEGELLEQVFGGRVTQLPLDALDNPQLPELIPHGAVAVIDECWRRWPSGQRVSHAAKDDLQWLKEHRHRVDVDGNAMQVVLVTQDPGDLASWVRKLIAHSFHMLKLDTVGASGKFGIQVYQGCPTGARLPEKLMIRQAYGTYKPEVYQYYKSATQSKSFDVGDEKAMDKRTNIWTSGGMIATIAFVLLAIPLGIWSLSYFFGMADRAKAEQLARQPGTAPRLQAAPLAPLPSSPAVSGAAVPAPAPAPAARLESGPLPSTLWRVSGYLKRKDSRPQLPAPAEWSSRMGYGVQLDQGEAKAGNWQEDQAILTSLAGMRTVPLSACVQFPNSVHYYCDLDGERVTPWTGQQGLSQAVGAQPLASAKAAVSSEQSEERSAAAAPRS